jgi:hypothetical protein
VKIVTTNKSRELGKDNTREYNLRNYQRIVTLSMLICQNPDKGKTRGSIIGKWVLEGTLGNQPRTTEVVRYLITWKKKKQK